MVVLVVVVAGRIVVDVVLAGGGTFVVVARVGCSETVAAVPSEPSPEHAAATSDTVAATMAIALVPRGRCAVSAPIRWRSIRRRWYFTGPPVDRMHDVQNLNLVERSFSFEICRRWGVSACARQATGDVELA